MTSRARSPRPFTLLTTYIVRACTRGNFYIYDSRQSERISFSTRNIALHVIASARSGGLINILFFLVALLPLSLPRRHRVKIKWISSGNGS